MIYEFEQAFPDQFVDRVQNIKGHLVNNCYIPENAHCTYSQYSIVDEFESIYHMGVLNEEQQKKIRKTIDFVETSENINFESSGPY